MSAELKSLPPEGSRNKGKLNIYTCEKCNAHIVTKDVDDGVTPFMTPCDDCDGMMLSSFYRVWDQSMRPDYEWYRPENTDGLSKYVKDHVDKGGLIMRKHDV